jgi:pimeloyl-ACP methyl ester carboxylesterase
MHGGRKQLTAPMADVLLFSRDWGFRVADIQAPVRWWHGDADHIVPFAHGEHVVGLLPDAKLFVLPGESHLGSLGEAEQVLDSLLEVWHQA